MISRYEVKEISHIWNEDEKFKYYLEVEVAHLMTLEKEGIVPIGTTEKIIASKINSARSSDIEKTTNHEVI